MFTGIVEETGEIVGVSEAPDGRRLRIAAGDVLSDLEPGASINVSGVCLTVEEIGSTAELAGFVGATDTYVTVFVAAETASVTYLDTVVPGDEVNLERALAADERLDGHIVQGHVDTTATVTAIDRVGEDWQFSFSIPTGYSRYLARKGAVALDGISLTIADRSADSFEVAIVPTTYDRTTLSEKTPGDPVHVEIDVLARYVDRVLADQQTGPRSLSASSGRDDDGVTGDH